MKKIILVLLSALLLIGMGQLSYPSEETPLEILKDALAFYSDFEGDLQGRKLIGASFLLSQITKPKIMNELTEDEKAQVTMLSSRVEKAKKDLTKEELEQLAQQVAFLTAAWEGGVGEPVEERTEEELAELDTLLRSQWNEMRAALARNDIDKAVSYFAYENRELYRKIYTALADQLPQVAQDMGDITPVAIEHRTAKYRLIRKEVVKGKTYDITYYVYFIRDSDGVWRIFRY
ncbi:MAG: hypothetical protein JXA50_02630 [Deltaproteobacteria bacterium]|nr:hypothetical protein [Deltaproteobacteria bacterium]